MVIWDRFQGIAHEWDDLIISKSGSLYQSYGWGEVRRVAGWTPLRLIATEHGKVVAAASILVKRKFGFAMCWVPGGPVGSVRLLSKIFLKNLSSALGTNFFYIRISHLRSGSLEECRYLAANNWLRPSSKMSSGHSMLYSLCGTDSDRLKRTTGNWRHNLKRSSRYELSIERWFKPDISAISALYREMESFKTIPTQHSELELAAMFEYLKDQIIVYRCTDAQGKLLALRAAGIFGDTALDLLAVAGIEARKVYASHATLWALLNHCSECGVTSYDLSGVDKIHNKGVYDFKHGTGAELVECLGEWESSSIPGVCFAINWLIGRRVQSA